MTRELAQHSQAKCGNCGRQGNQSKSRLRSYIYKTGDSQCDLCLTKKTCIALHNMAPRKLVILPDLTSEQKSWTVALTKLITDWWGGKNQPATTGTLKTTKCPRRSPVIGVFNIQILPPSKWTTWVAEWKQNNTSLEKFWEARCKRSALKKFFSEDQVSMKQLSTDIQKINQIWSQRW